MRRFLFRPTASFALLTGFLVAFPVLCAAQEAGDDAETRLAVELLLDEMGAVETVVASIKSGIPIAKASTPELPEEFWDKFTRAILTEVDDLVDELVPLYVERFSLEEIQALTAFYRTPVGRHLVEEQPSMLAESQQIGAAWGERVALQVAQKMMTDPHNSGRIGAGGL